MHQALLVVAVALVPIGLNAQQQPNSAVRTTVCELIREPDRYNGKLVEIDAQLSWSDEGSVVFHQDCTGSILFGISPQIDANAASRRHYRRLMGLRKKMKKTNVQARVAGVFEHSPERVWGHMAMFDSRLLTISVSGIRAAPRNTR